MADAGYKPLFENSIKKLTKDFSNLLNDFTGDDESYFKLKQLQKKAVSLLKRYLRVKQLTGFQDDNIFEKLKKLENNIENYLDLVEPRRDPEAHTEGDPEDEEDPTGGSRASQMMAGIIAKAKAKTLGNVKWDDERPTKVSKYIIKNLSSKETKEKFKEKIDDEEIKYINYLYPNILKDEWEEIYKNMIEEMERYKEEKKNKKKKTEQEELTLDAIEELMPEIEEKRGEKRKLEDEEDEKPTKRKAINVVEPKEDLELKRKREQAGKKIATKLTKLFKEKKAKKQAELDKIPKLNWSRLEFPSKLGNTVFKNKAQLIKELEKKFDESEGEAENQLRTLIKLVKESEVFKGKGKRKRKTKNQLKKLSNEILLKMVVNKIKNKKNF
jgi:hypothetical protein